MLRYRSGVLNLSILHVLAVCVGLCRWLEAVCILTESILLAWLIRLLLSLLLSQRLLLLMYGPLLLKFLLLLDGGEQVTNLNKFGVGLGDTLLPHLLEFLETVRTLWAELIWRHGHTLKAC